MATNCSIPVFEWGLPETLSEQAQDISGAACAVWSWCPCDPEYDFKYCVRNEAQLECPMPDITDDKCAGAGGWYLVCGDGCLGPPCRAGAFYGEVVMLCRCPSVEQPEEHWSITADESTRDCPEDFPSGMPHPWALPHSRHTGDMSENVPLEIFPYEECGPDAKGWWTWCPCDDNDDAGLPTPTNTLIAYTSGIELMYPINDPDELLGGYTQNGELNGKPKYSGPNGWCLWFDTDIDRWTISASCGVADGKVWIKSDGDYQDCAVGTYTPGFLSTAEGVLQITPECPWVGELCADSATGDGKWIFRGGCPDLGPPPVLGRYYGETLAIGHCCAEFTSSQTPSETSPEPESGSCGPVIPAFEWFLHINEQNPQEVFDQGSFCTIPDTAGWWVWCQCDDVQDCNQLFGIADDCPYIPPELIGEPTAGKWAFIGGIEGAAPPTRGRFYGEIVWVGLCTPPVGSSESLQSLQSSEQVISQSSEDPMGPPILACTLCPEGLPPVLSVSVVDQTSVNRTCANCNAFFNSLVDIPLVYQGMITLGLNTYHLWRSAQFSVADCAGIFDEHVISVLVRTINPDSMYPSCQTLGFFHHINDTNMSSTSFGYYIQWSTAFYAGPGNNDICVKPSFFMGTSGSADISLNCNPIPFGQYNLEVKS